MAQSHHMIYRQRISVHAATNNGLALQSRIATLVKEKVTPLLEQAFDRLAPSDQWLIIDTLNIQIAPINENELDDKLAERIARSITHALQDRKDRTMLKATPVVGEQTKIIPDVAHTWQAFLYYIAHGVLPWWYDLTAQETFDEKVEKALLSLQREPDPAAIEGMKQLLQEHRHARRFVIHFSERLYGLTLSLLVDTAHNGDVNWIEPVREITGWIKNLLPAAQAPEAIEKIQIEMLQQIAQGTTHEKSLRLVLAYLSYQYLDDAQKQLLKTAPFTHSLLINAVNASNPSPEMPEPTAWTKRPMTQIERPPSPREKPLADPQEIFSKEGIVVNNAGLVILAPFMPAFLRDCELVNANDELLDPGKAIGLMQYLVNGTLDYKEYDVALNKILCGVPPQYTASRLNELTEEEVSNANTLLEAVIGHWKILQDTTADGLREGFLQRRGRMTFKNDTWVLQVEQSTIDILLQSLPWTIGMIQLPWMKTMLRVEWN